MNADSAKKFIYYGDLNNQLERVNASASLLKLHDFIMNFRNEKAITWFPDQVAVHAIYYDNPTRPSIKWPASWPDLTGHQSKKISHYESVIYLDKKYFNDLLALFTKRGNTQAFEINNKDYYIYYQLPIPGIDSVNAQ